LLLKKIGGVAKRMPLYLKTNFIGTDIDRCNKKKKLTEARDVLYIPLTNRVRGPYWKLRNEFFPLRLGQSARTRLLYHRFR